MTIAGVGYGTTVQLDNAAGTLTSIGEAVSVKPYGYSVDTVEATHLSSPSAHKEFIAALIDVGEGNVTVNHDQHSATDQLLRAAMLDRVVRTFKVTFPDGATFACECIVTGYEPAEIAAGDKMTCTFSVKFTGVPTFAAS